MAQCDVNYVQQCSGGNVMYAHTNLHMTDSRYLRILWMRNVIMAWKKVLAFESTNMCLIFQTLGMSTVLHNYMPYQQ